MMLDALKRNRTCSSVAVIICLSMYVLLYSTTPNISNKPKDVKPKDMQLDSMQPRDMQPKTRLDKSKPVFRHEVQSRSQIKKTPPFRQPVKWNRIMSKVISGTSFRMPKKYVNGQPLFKDTRKPIPKLKMPETFYGDCYAYSVAGISVRPSDVIKRNGCQKRLPKAMIIGVKKCGTMMLTHYLSLHPMVVIRGEIEFPNGQKLTTHDVEQWRERMQLSSPRMFSMTGKPLGANWTNGTSGRLQSLMDKNAKVIMIIRDPVIRAVSDYVHTNDLLSKNGSQALLAPFSEIVVESQTGEVIGNDPIVAKGRYIDKFRQVSKQMGPHRLLVLDGEAFIQDPLPIMIQTERFLGLTPFFERKHFQRNPETGFYCANVPERPNFKCANPAIKGRPHPKVDDGISEKLYDYYRPFNMEMAKEAGLYFPWLFQ